MTQGFGFPNLLGVFLQNAPTPLPTMNNQAALVDLALEGLPFGAIVTFKVLNGTNESGRWLVRVELKSLQYGFIRRGSSIALNLAAGETSGPQRISQRGPSDQEYRRRWWRRGWCGDGFG